jgi:hypothetical protein
MKIDYNRLEAEIIAVFNHNKKMGFSDCRRQSGHRPDNQHC